jgi:hypothetical protein
MPEPTIAWSDLLDDLYPRLHASDEASLQWWTEAQLRQFANEALQLLSRGARIFVRRNAATNTVNGTRTYALPARHLATLHVAYANVPLQPTDFAHLDALNATASAAACGVGEVPKRWYEDTLGVHLHIGIWPTPSAVAVLALLFSEQLDLFTSTASTAPIPRCLKAFIEDYVLSQAWSHDSDFAMPELAAHLAEKRQMQLDLYQSLWGPPQ